MLCFKYYFPNILENNKKKCYSDVLKSSHKSKIGIIGDRIKKPLIIQTSVIESNETKTTKHNDKNENFSLFIKEKEIGKIIGYGGSNINKIRENSGARITIKQESNKLREVIITGNNNNIEKAKSLINYYLENERK